MLCSLGTVALVLVCGSSSFGIVQVTSSGPGTSSSVTENPPGSGSYDVVLTRAATPGNTADGVFTITRSLSIDRIGTLTFKSQQSLARARADIELDTAPVASIGSIVYGSGTNDAADEAVVKIAWVSGDLGAVDISGFAGTPDLGGHARIGGSATGNISIRTVENSRAILGDFKIGGNLLGSISVADNPTFTSQKGIIERLEVSGNVGSALNPVTIRANNPDIIEVEGSMDATVEGAVPGQTPSE